MTWKPKKYCVCWWTASGKIIDEKKSLSEAHVRPQTIRPNLAKVM